MLLHEHDHSAAFAEPPLDLAADAAPPCRGDLVNRGPVHSVAP